VMLEIGDLTLDPEDAEWFAQEVLPNLG